MDEETDKPTTTTDEDTYRQIWGDEPKQAETKREPQVDPWALATTRADAVSGTVTEGTPHEETPTRAADVRTESMSKTADSVPKTPRHFGLTPPRLAWALVIAFLLGLLSAFEFASVASTGSMTLPNPFDLGTKVALDLVDLMLGAGVGTATLGLAMIVLRSR